MLSRHYPSVNGSLAQPFAATFLLCCISAQWLCFPTTVFSHTRTRQWLSFGVNIPLYKNLINLYTARMLRRADRKPQCLWWYDICCVFIFEARRNRFADLAPFPVYCRLRLSAPALATADQWAVLAFYIVSQPSIYRKNTYHNLFLDMPRNIILLGNHREGDVAISRNWCISPFCHFYILHF